MHTRLPRSLARLAWWLLGLALVALMGACGADSATAADLTGTAPTSVSPTTTASPTPVEGEPLRTRLAYGTEPDQFAWLQLPGGPVPDDGFPVVVLVHGGFWLQQFDVSLMDDLAADLAEHGYASWNIEYRRVGGAGGWPATGQDVVAAIDYLAVAAVDHPLDLQRVVLVGHSAGGHLGLWALGQPSQITVQGSVGLGAVVDLAYFRESQSLLGGTADDVPDVYRDAAPVLDPERVVLIQGSADSIVPEVSLQVAQDLDVPIVIIDGDNHFDLIDPDSDAWAAAITAIENFVTG